MSDNKRIAIIDDDASIRDGVSMILEAAGYQPTGFVSGDAFLDSGRSEDWRVGFLDLKMPGRSGFDVLRELTVDGQPLPFPIIMISAHGDVKAAVQAMKLGASSFVEKPFTAEALEEAVADIGTPAPVASETDALMSELTPRERDVAHLLDEGLTNKEVARKLDCSPRTVEIHRARVLKKLGVKNVAGLVRLLSGRSTDRTAP
ncbi:MAG: response regulator [Pseudomonadota bacterium]